jgi:hypothetical protein
VTADFTQYATIAATDDQHALRIAMSDQWNMCEHFVINKLITFGGLHNSIQRKHPPELLIAKD